MTAAVEEMTKPTIEQELFTVQDTSRMLGVSVPTIYRLIAKQEIKSVKLGGRALVTRRTLSDLLTRLGA